MSHMRKAFNKVDDDMQIDSALFNPDELWRRPQVTVHLNSTNANIPPR